jgi:hypothetical protein
VQFEFDLTTHQMGRGFQADFLFGVGTTPTSAAVPEPSSILLIDTALAILVTFHLARRLVRAVLDSSFATS